MHMLYAKAHMEVSGQLCGSPTIWVWGTQCTLSGLLGKCPDLLSHATSPNGYLLDHGSSVEFGECNRKGLDVLRSTEHA